VTCVVASTIGKSVHSPAIRLDNISVAFAFSLRVSDLCRAHFHIPHILRNSGYKFDSVVVYLDVESPSLSDLPPCKYDINPRASQFSLRKDGTLAFTDDESIVRGLNDLLKDKVIHEIRLVTSSSSAALQFRLKRILFASSNNSNAEIPSKEFLGLLLPLEECKSSYCAHLDMGMTSGFEFTI